MSDMLGSSDESDLVLVPEELTASWQFAVTHAVNVCNVRHITDTQGARGGWQGTERGAPHPECQGDHEGDPQRGQRIRQFGSCLSSVLESWLDPLPPAL